MRYDVSEAALKKLHEMRKDAVQSQRAFVDSLDSMVLALHGESVDLERVQIDFDTRELVIEEEADD